MTADTCAEHTFLARGMVPSDILASAQMMFDVTGHCVQLRGPKRAQLGVGGQEVQLPVYLAETQPLTKDETFPVTVDITLREWQPSVVSDEQSGRPQRERRPPS